MAAAKKGGGGKFKAGSTPVPPPQARAGKAVAKAGGKMAGPTAALNNQANKARAALYKGSKSGGKGKANAKGGAGTYGQSGGGGGG